MMCKITNYIPYYALNHEFNCCLCLNYRNSCLFKRTFFVPSLACIRGGSHEMAYSLILDMQNVQSVFYQELWNRGIVLATDSSELLVLK